MEVRALSADSWEEGDAILRAVYLGNGYVDAAHADGLAMSIHAGAGIWLGAFDGSGSLVGLLLVTSFGSSAAVVAEPGAVEVRLLAVASAARRSGAGRALMVEAESVAQTLGCVAMTFSTQITMTAAQTLYHSLGYVRTESRDYMVGTRQFLVFHKQFEV